MFIFTANKAFFKFTLVAPRYYSFATDHPPSLSLLHLLQLSISHQSLKLTQQSHAQVCHLGLTQHPVIVTKLISAYSACKYPIDSHLVFNSVSVKNVFIYNTMINGYAKNCLFNQSFDLFNQMSRCTNVLPDEFTLSILSKISADLREIFCGKSVHGKCIRIGFASDIVVANSLISLYCKCESFRECLKVFDEMSHRNVSSWNVVVSGYASLKEHDFDIDVWEIFKDMQSEGFNPDEFTVSSLFPLCGSDIGKWDYGRELHCYVVKNELYLGLGSDVHLGCCLIDMYSRNNKVELARLVFDRLKCRNVYAWTAMINGYVQHGCFDEGLVLFRGMQERDGIEPNKVSLVSVLPACSSLSCLIGGKQIHGFAIRKEMNNEVSLCNALIDMYSKCGSLFYARQVFEYDCISKDAISWSSIISGYGLHGRGKTAIVLYDKMLQIGIKPDMITIVGVLSSCGRSGLVDEGLRIYSSVVNDFKIKPTLEICSCMVDILGRSGQLDRALDFIKTMPVKPGPSAWGALFSASVLNGNSEMQDLASKSLIQMEPENPSNYISLSNLCAAARRWDVLAEVRTKMKERGLRKLPGCSWININSKTHNFYVADKAHPNSDMIYDMLDELMLTMKEAGYSPDLESFSSSYMGLQRNRVL